MHSDRWDKWDGGMRRAWGRRGDDIGYSSGSGPHLGCGHARMKMPSSFSRLHSRDTISPLSSSPSSTPFTHGNRACPTFLRLKIHSQYVRSRTHEIRSPPLPRIRRRRIIVARSGEEEEAWGGEKKKAPSSHLLGGGGPKNRMGFPPFSFPILLWLGRKEKKFSSSSGIDGSARTEYVRCQDSCGGTNTQSSGKLSGRSPPTPAVAQKKEGVRNRRVFAAS